MVKKILATLAVLNTLFFTAPTIVPKTEAASFVKKQELTYNLESLTEEFYDNKSFEINAIIGIYSGFDKHNEYEIKYEYITEKTGNLNYELLTANNLTFKRKNAAPVFSIFGEQKPAPKENFRIQRFSNDNFSYDNLTQGISLGKYQKNKIYTGIKPWEYKQKLEESQKKFEHLKKLMNIENKIEKSKGKNNHQLILSIDPLTIKDQTPNTYYTDTAYDWYDLNCKDWNLTYEANTNTITIYKESQMIGKRLEIIYKDKKPIRIELDRESKNQTIFRKDQYIKEIYTQEQIDQIFQHVQKIYDQVQEKIKDLPYVETPEEYFASPY